MTPQSAPLAEHPDFRLLFESSPDLYLVFTRELAIIGVSDSYLLATGMVRHQMLGRNIRAVFPDFRGNPRSPSGFHLAETLERVLRTRRPEVMRAHRCDVTPPHTGNGRAEERYWRPSNSPILDSNGEVSYIVHRVEDVTELFRLKQAAAELDRTNESRLEGVHRSNAADHRTEEELSLSRKLEGVGQIAGEMAHQLNNLLGVISGYSSMLLRQVEPGSSLHRGLEEMHNAGNRAAALTQQLLAASHEQPLPLTPARSLPELQSQFKSILLVDDERAMREVTRAMLEESGFEVATAENGVDARRKASEHAFDLVITDLSMPEEDGFEAMSGLRAKYPDLKIIAVTGGFGPSILETAKVLGADATLMKPFTNEMLLDTMQGLLKAK